MEFFTERELNRSDLETLQWQRLQSLVAKIIPDNAFYAKKFAEVDLNAGQVASWEDFRRLPFTTKVELLGDQANHPKYGSILTYPESSYRRYHQTSGTTGKPLRWLDTLESWQWMLNCWRKIFAIVGVTPEDRLFFPFSFGPFLGFWSAFEAAELHGCLCLPGGGLSTAARLQFLIDVEATVVLCTPTYALHLAEVAHEHDLSLSRSNVRCLIVAGEPGGSIPATKERIESSWGAKVFDHSGLTEVGPLSIECPTNPGGLHILEGDYLAEVVDPTSGQPMATGEVGELIVTNLGRAGSPLLRYRTGDLVRVTPESCPCGLPFVRLDGGILGRCDELLHLRGNNVYPSALEAIIREFSDVVEFQITVDQRQSLASLDIQVEARAGVDSHKLARSISEKIRDRLLFRADVRAVSAGSLPRFELKARRLTVKR